MSNELSFNQYAKDAKSTALYPPEAKVLYSTLGLVDEATEVMEKLYNRIWPDAQPDLSKTTWVLQKYMQEAIAAGKKCGEMKKRLRGDKGASFDQADLAELVAAVKKNVIENSGAVAEVAPEIGDVQWYLPAICDDLGLKLEDVAKANTEKLASRKARGVLQGNGDKR